MLEKSLDDEKQLKKLKRIQSSADTISSLYENLEILIKKDLKKENIDLYPILEEKKENCNILYPYIKFDLVKSDMIVYTNQKAISRIIDNILSNGCKYSQGDSPFIKIWFENNKLYIKDNGKGMQYPQKIFERSYSENDNGHGIGMHIVHRLSSELDIKVDISSKEHIGTTIEILF
jgi:signal transduction histidine kinase